MKICCPQESGDFCPTDVVPDVCPRYGIKNSENSTPKCSRRGFFKNESWVHLQSSVNFCCIAKWPSHTYLYILHSFASQRLSLSNSHTYTHTHIRWCPHTYSVEVDLVFPKGIQCTNMYQCVLDNNINDAQNNYAEWKKPEKKQGYILPGSIRIKSWKCKLLYLRRQGGKIGKECKVIWGKFGD